MLEGHTLEVSHCLSCGSSGKCQMPAFPKCSLSYTVYAIQHLMAPACFSGSRTYMNSFWVVVLLFVRILCVGGGVKHLHCSFFLTELGLISITTCDILLLFSHWLVLLRNFNLTYPLCSILFTGFWIKCLMFLWAKSALPINHMITIIFYCLFYITFMAETKCMSCKWKFYFA